MANKTKLEYKRSNTWLIPFQLTTAFPSPDYTGWRIEFMVKRNKTDSNEDAIFKYDIIPNSITGYGELIIEDEVTATYPVGSFFYDAKVIDADGRAGSSDIEDFVIQAVVNEGSEN